MSSSPPELSIEQFAAIVAAEQEGFELAEVLDVEGVDESTWSGARPALLTRVVDDVDSFERYQQAMIEAQDRHSCPVEPVYDDLDAWVALVRLTDEIPLAELLDKHGMTSNDLARLQRHWKARFTGDSKLAKKAGKLREAAPGPELPPLKIGERKLLPSPYAAGDTATGTERPTKEAPRDEAERTSSADMERMVGLWAELEAGESVGDIWAEHGFDDGAQAVAAMSSWQAQLDSDARLRTDFRVLVEHTRRKRNHSSPREEPAPALDGQRDQRLQLEAPLDEHPPKGPQLPASLPWTEDAAPAQASAKPSVLDQTGVVNLELLAEAALPFEPAPPGSQSVDETCEVDIRMLGLDTLPFGAAAVEGGDREPDDLDGTRAVLPALRDLPVTPWTDGQVQKEGTSPERADTDSPRPVSVDETAIVTAVSDEPALPFTTPADEPAPESSPEAEDAAPSDPCGEPSPPSSKQSATTLTVEQYASYCVELALYPQQAEQVRARYQIGALSQHKEIASHWRARFDESPELLNRWRDACKRYQAHLMKAAPQPD